MSSLTQAVAGTLLRVIRSMVTNCSLFPFKSNPNQFHLYGRKTYFPLSSRSVYLYVTLEVVSTLLCTTAPPLAKMRHYR